MTFHDWIFVVLTILGMAGGTFAWLWSETRRARSVAGIEKAALQAKLDLLESKNNQSLFNVKKDVFDKIKEERDALHERCDRMERDLQTGHSEFTKELRSISETFSRTCDGIQTKIEHLTSTIIGQYVPRAEIDNRFARIDEKQDRVLNILYDMKK